MGLQVQLMEPNTFNVGDEGNFQGLLVKIAQINGGLFYLETPHGSVISIGFARLPLWWRQFTPEERAQYDLWVIDAARQRAELAKQ